LLRAELSEGTISIVGTLLEYRGHGTLHPMYFGLYSRKLPYMEVFPKGQYGKLPYMEVFSPFLVKIHGE